MPTACSGLFDDAEMARHGRDLGGGGRLLRFDLVAHRRDGARVRADEDDACGFERVRKGLALGQEAVARMHRLRAGRAAGLDDLVDDEIGLRGRRRADMDGLVGHLDVQRVAVGVGVDRDGRDAHAPRRLDDPAGDLAPVGDEDLLEHAPSAPARRRGARRHLLRPVAVHAQRIRKSAGLPGATFAEQREIDLAGREPGAGSAP